MNLRITPVLAALLLVCALAAAAAPQAAPAAKPVGKLGFFIGDVRCRTGAGPWSPARLEQPLTTSHELLTGKESRAELSLGQSVIRLGERSQLRLADLKVDDGQAEGAVQLLFGSLWSRLRGLGGAGLQVKSPTAVMAVRGTIFRADAAADSSLSMWVYEGQVDMGAARPFAGAAEAPAAPVSPGVPSAKSGPRPVPGPFEITLDEWVRVTQGMRFTLRPDGRYALEPIEARRDSLDSWVRWNLERDAGAHD